MSAERCLRVTVLIGYTREQQLQVSVYLGAAGSSLVTKHFPTSALKFPKTDLLIYHATVIGGESALWKTKTFLEHYKPLIAKRLAGFT